MTACLIPRMRLPVSFPECGGLIFRRGSGVSFAKSEAVCSFYRCFILHTRQVGLLSTHGLATFLHLRIEIYFRYDEGTVADVFSGSIISRLFSP